MLNGCLRSDDGQLPCCQEILGAHNRTLHYVVLGRTGSHWAPRITNEQVTHCLKWAGCKIQKTKGKKLLFTSLSYYAAYGRVTQWLEWIKVTSPWQLSLVFVSWVISLAPRLEPTTCWNMPGRLLVNPLIHWEPLHKDQKQAPLLWVVNKGRSHR